MNIVVIPNDSADSTYQAMYEIVCQGCGVATSRYDAEAEVIESWNTRSQDVFYDGYDKASMENAVKRGSIAREDFTEVRQAFIELNHAHFEPNWFTKAQRGANEHFISWLNRGKIALEKVLSKIEDNND